MNRLYLAATVFGGSFIALRNCIYNVEAGHRGLIFDRFRGGIQSQVYAEGTHFYIPGIQSPVILDVRTTPRRINSVTGTKDLQTVNISLRVLSRPKVENLATIYKKLGRNFNEVILPSLGNEVLKAIVAQYNAEQLLTQREEVSRQIKDSLKQRCSKFNILLDDVALTHLQYGDEFAKAIEDKQVAEQRAERAKFIVAKAEQEKKARIIRSEGEAESADLVSDALASYGSGMLKLRQIETAQQIAETLSKNKGIIYLPKMDGTDGKASNTGLLLNVH